ncbi:hypothetical protein ACPJHQ_04955 [Rossellomorea sp. H39__3]
MFGVMSELERNMNRERMVTGLAAACARGRRGEDLKHATE